MKDLASVFNRDSEDYSAISRVLFGGALSNSEVEELWKKHCLQTINIARNLDVASWDGQELIHSFIGKEVRRARKDKEVCMQGWGAEESALYELLRGKTPSDISGLKMALPEDAVALLYRSFVTTWRISPGLSTVKSEASELVEWLDENYKLEWLPDNFRCNDFKKVEKKFEKLNLKLPFPRRNLSRLYYIDFYRVNWLGCLAQGYKGERGPRGFINSSYISLLQGTESINREQSSFAAFSFYEAVEKMLKAAVLCLGGSKKELLECSHNVTKLFELFVEQSKSLGVDMPRKLTSPFEALEKIQADIIGRQKSQESTSDWFDNRYILSGVVTLHEAYAIYRLSVRVLWYFSIFLAGAVQVRAVRDLGACFQLSQKSVVYVGALNDPNLSQLQRSAFLDGFVIFEPVTRSFKPLDGEGRVSNISYSYESDLGLFDVPKEEEIPELMHELLALESGSKGYP